MKLYSIINTKTYSVFVLILRLKLLIDKSNNTFTLKLKIR